MGDPGGDDWVPVVTIVVAEEWREEEMETLDRREGRLLLQLAPSTASTLQANVAEKEQWHLITTVIIISTVHAVTWLSHALSMQVTCT